jgi:predicted DNA-binding transcriptional regulator YafY
VRILYRGRSQPNPLQRDLDPYLLVHGWGWHYCLGYCHLRQGIRSFRVDRIAELSLLNQSFEIPTDFDIAAYVAAEPFFQSRIEVRLAFDPDAALQALDNRACWDSLETQADGSIIVNFAIPNLEAAAAVFLHDGYLAEVLAPPELRDLVFERTTAIAARHRMAGTPNQAPKDHNE